VFNAISQGRKSFKINIPKIHASRCVPMHPRDVGIKCWYRILTRYQQVTHGIGRHHIAGPATGGIYVVDGHADLRVGLT